ncbi:MAG: glycosyltransferase family 4 protein [Desulfobulbaceae bacterium]|nr:glycosyltransferase family 4 protein [Desulfobulbaceae bacterium]
MKKILLVGPYPPPFGGISVQILRLQKSMQRSGFHCQVLNIGEFRSEDIQGSIAIRNHISYLWNLLYFASRGYTIHIVTSGHNFKSWLSALACSLAGLINRKRSVIAVGSGLLPKYIASSRGLKKIIIRLTLKLAGAVICRNDDSKTALILSGAPKKSTAIIPGFLGVDPAEIGEVPGEIQKFIGLHQPVIGAHAILDPEYGLQLLLDAFSDLVKDFPNIGIILIGLKESDAEQFSVYQLWRHQILPTGFLQHPTTLAVIRSLRIFVRATLFDGDSNSVREALSLKVPVVASNTDFRPPGVTLFTVGDRMDLVLQVKKILKEQRKETAPTAPVPRNEVSKNFNKIIDIYNQLAMN